MWVREGENANTKVHFELTTEVELRADPQELQNLRKNRRLGTGLFPPVAEGCPQSTDMPLLSHTSLSWGRKSETNSLGWDPGRVKGWQLKSEAAWGHTAQCTPSGCLRPKAHPWVNNITLSALLSTFAPGNRHPILLSRETGDPRLKPSLLKNTGRGGHTAFLSHSLRTVVWERRERPEGWVVKKVLGWRGGAGNFQEKGEGTISLNSS